MSSAQNLLCGVLSCVLSSSLGALLSTFGVSGLSLSGLIRISSLGLRSYRLIGSILRGSLISAGWSLGRLYRWKLSAL